MEPSNRETAPVHTTVAQPQNRSRVGATWVSLVVFLVILIALIIFILQNSKIVNIQYLGAHGSVSFGVAMLVAAVAGSVLTVLIGSVRILQLKLKNKASQRTP
jgi:putative membrane protein